MDPIQPFTALVTSPDTVQLTLKPDAGFVLNPETPIGVHVDAVPPFAGPEAGMSTAAAMAIGAAIGVGVTALGVGLVAWWATRAGKKLDAQVTSAMRSKPAAVAA